MLTDKYKIKKISTNNLLNKFKDIKIYLNQINFKEEINKNYLNLLLNKIKTLVIRIVLILIIELNKNLMIKLMINHLQEIVKEILLIKNKLKYLDLKLYPFHKKLDKLELLGIYKVDKLEINIEILMRFYHDYISYFNNLLCYISCLILYHCSNIT